MAAVAGSGVVGWGYAGCSEAWTIGMAAVGGPGVVDTRASACAACSCSAARSRSAARAAARVVGVAALEMAAVGVSGVVPEISGVSGAAVLACTLLKDPLGWARRRPVGLVRSPSIRARRG